MSLLNAEKQKIANAFSPRISSKKPHLILNAMKPQNLYRLLFSLVVILFTITSCVKQGPMGLTGANGTNGANGKDANTACLKCHTTAVMDQKKVEYQLSKHFLGTSSARNTKYCARCHTSDGFKEITANGKFVVANDIPAGERINCSTCHNHSGFDFAGDTATYILRTTTPIALNYYNNTKTQDFGKINNLCVTCHQIRGATAVNFTDSTGKVQTFKQLPFFPLDNALENTTVKFQVGQSISVHDGNQSNLFSGINGYEYTGKVYTRTWKHSEFSCTDCHMNSYSSVSKTGGHTLIVNEAQCVACHSTTGTADPIERTQAAISGKIIELRELLVAKKIFAKIGSKTAPGPQTFSYSAMATHDFYGNLLPSSPTPAAKTYGIATASANTVDPKTGLVVYANNITMAVDLSKAATTSAAAVVGSADRLGREWKYGELGAAYNYGYINSELSLGVHNPIYALQILQNSIDYLKSY